MNSRSITIHDYTILYNMSPISNLPLLVLGSNGSNLLCVCVCTNCKSPISISCKHSYATNSATPRSCTLLSYSRGWTNHKCAKIKDMTVVHLITYFLKQCKRRCVFFIKKDRTTCSPYKTGLTFLLNLCYFPILFQDIKTRNHFKGVENL